METYSDHSAILDYLAQVEQEKQLRESLKSTSGIAALRVERGAGPYKAWEKQPLCDEHGEASSSSGNEESKEKEYGRSSIVSRKTLQYLVWITAALFILVVVGGTLLNVYGNPHHSAGNMRPEPPGSLLRHNALLDRHSNPTAHRAPAPATMSYAGPTSTPSIAPAALIAAPGLGPAPVLNAARDRHWAGGKRAGGFESREAEPASSAAVLAAAQYWREQRENEGIEEADYAWEDGDLAWQEPVSVQDPPLAAAWYWRNRAPGPVPGPQLVKPVPAPADAPKPSSRLPSWAHAAQYFSSAAQGLDATSSKPWQHMQGKPSTLDYPDAQPGAASRSAVPAQQSAYSGVNYEDIPSQAAMAAQIYNENPMMPKQAGQAVPKPSPKASGVSTWAPFHAVPKLPTAAHTAQASGATYLTPSEVATIGG